MHIKTCKLSRCFAITGLIVFLSFNSNAFVNIPNRKNIDRYNLILNEKIPNDSIAQIYCELGRELYKFDSVAKAISYFKKSADLFLAEKIYDHYCIQLESIGVMYIVKNQPKLGLEYFVKGLKATEKYKLKRSQYFSLIQNIGVLYCEAEQWKKSIEYFNKCEYFFRSDSCKAKELLIVNQINLGFSYHKINIIDSSLYYYNLALINCDKYNMTSYIGAVYLNIGDLYLFINESLKAKDFYKKSLDYSLISNDNRTYYRALLGFGSAEAFLQSNDSAIKHIEIAINYFNKNNDYLYARDAYKRICDIYENNGNWVSPLLI
ncbi:MAG: hypothetical protein WCK02_17795 [Bacteroidota bacterium]